MAIRHQILLLILVLLCAAIIHATLLDVNDAETCNLLCKQCNASGIFTDDHCECIFSDNSDEDAECMQRIQREIQAIDLNILSENPTNEERNVRSILKTRRRLRMGDADKVAQYFINGGPAAGHSHFLRAFNTAYDSANSTTNSFSGVVDESNPENEFHDVLLTTPISWTTYDSPLYMVSEAASRASPPMSAVETYTPILEMTNPVINYPTNGLYDSTSPLLGSITHPYGIHEHGPYHRTLYRTITFPGHVLHNLFTHRWSPHHPVYHGNIVRSVNSLQDGLPAIGSASQSCGNSDGSIASNGSPIVRNNADEPIGQNVATSISGLNNPLQHYAPMPYIYNTNALYQPTQYQRFDSPYQYTSYYNPLINVLRPVTDDYILQPVQHYMQSVSDPLTSASNPIPYCTNNANIQQKGEVLVATDKTVHSTEEAEKPNITIKNVAKEEKKTEEDGSNKS